MLQPAVLEQYLHQGSQSDQRQRRLDRKHKAMRHPARALSLYPKIETSAGSHKTPFRYQLEIFRLTALLN